MTTNPIYQKSVLDAYSSTTQTVAVNETIDFNNISVDTGCSIAYTAGSPTVTLRKPGLYYVSFTADMTPTGAGDITVSLFKNGTALPGATTTTTGVAATATRIVLSKVVQVLPSCPAINNITNLTFNNVGIAGAYNNVSLQVFKLC